MKKFLLIILLIVNFNNEANAKSYFSQNIITPNLIDQPLAVDSKAWKNEIATIIKLQKNPDKKQIAQALIERTLTPEMVVQAVDSKLTRNLYPKLYALLDNASDTSSIICDDSKEY